MRTAAFTPISDLAQALLATEGKLIAGGCQALIFLLALAITSIGCDKHWQALKVSRAATLHLSPSPVRASPAACKRLAVHPETVHRVESKG